MLVSTPEAPRSLFGIDAANRLEQRANYITEDFLLMTYSMILEDGIAAMEEKHAAPELAKLIAGLRQNLPHQPYIELLGALLDGSTPRDAKAAEELKLIQAA